jgi:single-stranded DNA-binding protein
VAINSVVLTGTVAEPGPKMTYSPASKPETKITLVVSEGKGEQTFNLYIPVFVYGAGAERVAEEVDAGDTVAVDGRLSWKSTLKKDGTKLGLCVSAFGVEVLVKAPTSPQDARSDAAEGDDEGRESLDAPEPDPAPNVRKRPYPKQALLGGFTIK